MSEHEPYEKTVTQLSKLHPLQMAIIAIPVMIVALLWWSRETGLLGNTETALGVLLLLVFAIAAIMRLAIIGARDKAGTGQ